MTTHRCSSSTADETRYDADEEYLIHSTQNASIKQIRQMKHRERNRVGNHLRPSALTWPAAPVLTEMLTRVHSHLRCVPGYKRSTVKYRNRQEANGSVFILEALSAATNHQHKYLVNITADQTMLRPGKCDRHFAAAWCAPSGIYEKENIS